MQRKTHEPYPWLLPIRNDSIRRDIVECMSTIIAFGLSEKLKSAEKHRVDLNIKSHTVIEIGASRFDVIQEMK